MVQHEYGSPAVAVCVATDPTAPRPGIRELSAVWRGVTMTADEDDPLPAAVGLLDDEYARAVLAIADGDPVSATELVERVDASAQTVYRRVDALTDAGLLAEATRPRSDGHHESVYVATFDELRVRLDDGRFEVSVETRGDDPADRLTDLWRRF